MYEPFTDHSRKLMQLANQEAQKLNHEYIGTEHILLGLISEGSGTAVKVLKNLDVDLERLRHYVRGVIMAGPEPVADSVTLPQTPRGKKVIEYAVEECRNLKHNYVGTEHILMGLLRDEEVAVHSVKLALRRFAILVKASAWMPRSNSNGMFARVGSMRIGSSNSWCRRNGSCNRR